MVLNNSNGKDYYTQRNNEIKPSGACNVTAMINALSAASWPVEEMRTARHRQPEDALMHFILTDPRIFRAWQRIDPESKYPPNEWHILLCMGTNFFLEEKGILPKGKVAVEFSEHRSVQDIVQNIKEGGAAVLSGIFPYRQKVLKHMVSCVGYSTRDNGDVESLLLDDPYGDYRDEYENRNGNDVIMSLDDFRRYIRNTGSMNDKVAHLVYMYKRWK